MNAAKNLSLDPEKMFEDADAALKMQKLLDAYVITVMKYRDDSLHRYMMSGISDDRFIGSIRKELDFITPETSFESYLEKLFFRRKKLKNILGFQYLLHQANPLSRNDERSEPEIINAAVNAAYQQNDTAALHDFAIGYSEIMLSSEPDKSSDHGIELVTGAARNNKYYAISFLLSLYQGEYIEEYRSKKDSIYWAGRLYEYYAENEGRYGEKTLAAFTDYLKLFDPGDFSAAELNISKINHYYEHFKCRPELKEKLFLAFFPFCETYYREKEDYRKLDQLYEEMGTYLDRFDPLFQAKILMKTAVNAEKLKILTIARADIVEGLELIIESRTADKPIATECKAEFGHICQLIDDFQQCIHTLEGIRSDVLLVFGEKHICFARLLADLSLAYAAMGNIGKSMDLIRKCVNIFYEGNTENDADRSDENRPQNEDMYLKRYGEIRTDILGAMCRLADFYSDNGEKQNATEVIRSCHDLSVGYISKEDDLYLEMTDLMAKIYKEESNYEAALISALECRRLCIKKYGTEAEETMDKALRIAEIYSNLEKPEKALEYAYMCCQFYSDNRDKYSMKNKRLELVLTYCSDIGMEQKFDMFHDQLEELYCEYLNLFGEDHIDTLTAKILLCSSDRKKDHEADALSECREAYDCLIRKYNDREHSPEIIAASMQLAALYAGNFENEEALKIAAETYEKSCDFYGAEHPETLKVLNSLIEYCGFVNGFDENIIEYQKEYYKTVCRVFGSDTMESMSALKDLSAYYFHANDYQNAIEQLEKVLEWEVRRYGNTHLIAIDTMCVLAYYMRFLSDYPDTALEYCQGFYDLCLEKFGEDNSYTEKALEHLEYVRRNYF